MIGIRRDRVTVHRDHIERIVVVVAQILEEPLESQKVVVISAIASGLVHQLAKPVGQRA